MIARLICLFAGHEYTTIAWKTRSKEWREKECLRCGKRKTNGAQLQPIIPKVPASSIDPPKTTPERTFR